MATLNFEFKAKATDINALEEKLLTLDPKYIGEDNQVDTYFNVATGRLKLREGNIENSLIYYERINTAGAKQSDILLYHHSPDKALKDILIKLHGVKVVVDKKRKIYFIDNVKFHFDKVEGLGTFVEVEAIDKDGNISVEKLKDQCSYYAAFFNIETSDYIAFSYSDLILEKKMP
ncbi:class IV adenylate cyclase [Ferruginibacter sp. SUN106]|uniref:class IV adenylate cyclase n=1 Tax=Ferruginibacter sp. SUN106 TaxID=2978348 RepID=UPI003D369312